MAGVAVLPSVLACEADAQPCIAAAKGIMASIHAGRGKIYLLKMPVHIAGEDAVDVRLMVADIVEQFVPDRPIVALRPAAQRFRADIP